jgi:hypothetical protein
MKRSSLFLSTLLLIQLILGMFLVPPLVGYAQTSLDWSKPVNLSNSGASTNPSVVVDTEGVIHVIWFDELDGYKYTNSPDGVEWSSPKKVNFPFPSLGDTKPTLVVDNKEIHILWRDQVSNKLYYSRSLSSALDVPSRWTNFTELANAVVSYDVKVGNEGNLYVSYISIEGSDTIPPGVVFRRLDGSGWSQPQILYPSQYFRSLKPEDANIHIGVSGGNTTDTVLIVWDDRIQKRIFLARSLDGGSEWENPVQISGPEDYIGLTLPFNINIGFFENKPLLTWWVGTPGVRCSLYSKYYIDEADLPASQSESREEFPFCPQKSEFFIQDGDFLLLSLSTQEDLYFIAWNGLLWSEKRNQSELSVFENPSTLDSVLLGCKEIAVVGNLIYSVGCDSGIGSDIWYRSRELGALDDWFPPTTSWKGPVQITSTNQNMSMLSSLDDKSYNVHLFWIQSALNDEIEGGTLEYSVWRNGLWSKPGAILAGINGRPLQFTASTGIPDRLILAWVDAETGGLLFSWANSDRADNPLEWDNPTNIPSNSQFISSPYILADASGRIVIVYAIPLNEQRGIYFVSSEDFGKTWSSPSLIFNAFAAGWDMVNQPMLALSGDGSLHLLFERFSLQGDRGKSVGLYYSRSEDGGNRWSEVDLVSDGLISWSKILTYDEKNVHRLWQEKNGTNLVNFHQFSQDGGLSWSTPVSVVRVSDDNGTPTVNVDWTGSLHLTQLVQSKNGITGSYHEWNGDQWTPQASYQIKSKGLSLSNSLTSSITSSGYLLSINLIDYGDPINGQTYELLSMGRSLDMPIENNIQVSALIATPPQQETSTSNGNRDLVSTPTTSSSITNLYDPSVSLSNSRNLTGIFFILGILILTVILLRPKSSKNR